MFLKKIALTCFFILASTQSTPITSTPFLLGDAQSSVSLINNQSDDSFSQLDTEDQTESALRGGPENKSFNNARVYKTLQTKDLYVEGNTVIGNNLKVDTDTFIAGNLIVDGAITGSTSGNVSGPGLSTINAIARFSDTTGNAITDSPVLIDNSGNMSSINDISMTGDLTGVENITVNDSITTQDMSSSGTFYVSALANINTPGAVVTWPTTVGCVGTFLGSDGAGNLVYSTPAGAGDVSAAANFTTNNRIVLTDTPNGSKTVKESTSVVIDSSDNIAGVNTLTATTVNAPTLNGNATTATNALNVGTQTALQVQTATIAANSATNANTPNRIVLRDGTGSFSAEAITATQFNGPLNGNATSANTATTANSADSFTGLLSGDVGGTQGSTVVNKVGGQFASDIANATVDVNTNATNTNTPGTLVRRAPGTGNFSGGTITAVTGFSGNLTGNVTGNLTGIATSAVMSDTAQWFAQDLAGDVTGPQLATIVAAVGNKSTAQVVQSVDDTIAATSNNTASTIVKRDGSKHFTANSITIVNNPSADTDATNKAYVDSIASGLEPKASVLVTSIVQTPTATLATPIDGVTLNVNDRVLLTQQSYEIDNGIWLAQSSDWTRPTDFSNGNLAGQAFVLTTSGLTLAGSGWVCSTPLNIIGTDTVTFVQYSSSGNTTGANVGSGVGEIFRDKTGLTLNFKTFAEGDFIAITNDMNEVTLAVTATSDNIANTIVSRDATGTFAGSLTGQASENVLKAGDTMTGNLIMANESEVRWARDTSTNYVGFKAPATGTFGYTVSLPNQAPTANQFLQALDSTSLTWTTVDAPPAATKTIYVALNGNDSNDGSFSAPLQHVSAAVTKANALPASLTNPVTINIGAGVFVETPPININVRGVSITGSTLASTILISNSPTTDLFTVNSADVMFSNLILRNTVGSTATAIAITAPDFGRTRIDNVGMSLFETGISYNGTHGLPFLYLKNFQCTDINTSLFISDAQTTIRSSLMQGASTGAPANTGMTITGTSCQVALFNTHFTNYDTSIEIKDRAHTRILACNFESNNKGIICLEGSQNEILGSNFILNNATSINITVSGASSEPSTASIIGCHIDGSDINDTNQGLGILITNQAKGFLDSCSIKNTAVGLQCGSSGDTITTNMEANAISLIDTTTDIYQYGTSTLNFVAGSFHLNKVFIEDALNVNFSAFSGNGNAFLALGSTDDTQTILYKIANGETSSPHLDYDANYYGNKGTVYINENDNPTFNATQSDINDASYYVVTGKNYKEACLHLISDSDDIGNAGDVRGWSICKTPTTAELAFTFTNNDPDQPARGPYTVMQLNGFDNQVEFPTASGTLPPNLTAKLLWGSDTNLYRSAADTLKTDDNFVVGGALSAGSTFISTITVGAGTAVNPSIQFAGSSGTGLSAQTPNRLSFDTGSVERMSISPTGTLSINEFTTAGVVHNNSSGQLSSSLIVNADIDANAAIVDTKLATISTAGKVLDSATTATSNNIYDTIVKRDTSGTFAASAITLDTGSATSPSLTFTNGTTTGIFAPTDDAIALSTNGVERMSIDATGTVEIYGTTIVAAGSVASPSLKFTNGSNTGFSSPIANKLSVDVNGIERMSMDATAVTVTAATLVVGELMAKQSIQSETLPQATVSAGEKTSILVLNTGAANRTIDTLNPPPNPINGQLFTILLGSQTADGSRTLDITTTTNTQNPVTSLSTQLGNMTGVANGPAVTYIYLENAGALAGQWYRYGR